MTGPENFLSRWSRKKQEDKQRDEKPDAAQQETPEPARDANDAATPAAAVPPGEGAPVFDPSTLPPLDSIGAQTDIGDFLKAGVPSELRHAALRRAWSLDPAIRDFKGLQENDWDFNDPNAIPGFAALGPDLDLKQALGAIFDETPNEIAPPAGEDVAPEPADGAAPEVPSEQTEIVQRQKNIASQDKDPDSESVPTQRRHRRGGALPQ